MAHVPMIEPQDADGETSEMFDEIQREMGIPFVPNLAASGPTTTSPRSRPISSVTRSSTASTS